MKRQLDDALTFPRCVRCIIATVLFAIGTSRALADGDVRTVALSFKHAPGTAAGVNFIGFGTGGGYFVLNNRGQVAFHGVLAGPGTTVTNRIGVWTEGRGNGLELVIRGEDPAPGRPGGPSVFGSLLSLTQLNNAGTTALGEHTLAFWTDNGTNALQLIADSGGVAIPGIAGAVFAGFPELSVLNDLNRVAVRGLINSHPSLLAYDPADGYHVLFQTVAGQAPGLPDGVLIDSAPGSRILSGTETNSGRYFVFARLVGGQHAFWVSDSAGAPQFVIRSGDPAPGVPGAAIQGLSNSNFRLNNLGQYAFYGDLLGDGINSTNNRGVWTGDLTTGPQLAARLGDHAPGTPDGVVLARFGQLHFNEQAQLAFAASLSGTGVSASNDSGVWLGGGATTLALLAREGEPAPGAGPGVLFGELNFVNEVEKTTALNNFGQMAFLSALTGPGVTTTNDKAIWAQDRNGVLRMIIREGDTLDVDDGPGISLKTISTLSVATDVGMLAHSLRLNDAGQIAFPAIFTDGIRGIFVSNAVAVPEPCAWMLVAIASLMVLPRPPRLLKS